MLRRHLDLLDFVVRFHLIGFLLLLLTNLVLHFGEVLRSILALAAATLSLVGGTRFSN